MGDGITILDKRGGGGDGSCCDDTLPETQSRHLHCQ